MKKLTFSEALNAKLGRLEKIDAPCNNLYFEGVDINELLSRPTVSMVGTRKPTPYGIQQTSKIAEELARAGVSVVSGLALGIDAIAHEGALQGKGTCIAVLPSDVEHVYPATNKPLAKRILKEGGALVSEHESNSKPKKVDFLVRNRIVAALSDAVIITEAAAQSGTLNTARHAREMGIQIYVLPGHVNSPMSDGCNWLIQQGAKLMTSAEDVLRGLGVDTAPQQTLDLSSSSPNETLVLQKIVLGHQLTDELLKETDMSLGDLQEVLTMLEIDGRISQNVLGKWELL